MKYRAWYTTTASAFIDFEVEEGDDLVAEAERAEMEQGLPSLCAHCSGWNQQQGIELGDWEPADEKFGPNIERIEDES